MGRRKHGFPRGNLASFLILMMVFVSTPAAAAISPDISAGSYDGPASASQITNSRNTTYFYNYTYDLSWTIGSAPTRDLWIPILSNRTVLSEDGTVHQQEVRVLSQTYTSDPVDAFQAMEDEHGNQILNFNLTTTGTGSFQLTMLANYTLRDITWASNASTFNYNESDPSYIRYTREEEFINKSTPQIAGNASVLNNSNPFTAAKNIYEFVTGLLTYEVQDYEYGADYAIINKTGDCTEYSYLMVALLRACGIPARVLRGLVLSTSGVAKYDSPVDTEFSYRFFYQDGGSSFYSNLTGHAWLEYFIPGYGWILADPTWFNVRDYSRSIDNIHVPFNIGVWTRIDGDDTTAFSTVPYPMYVGAPDNGFTHDVYFQFKVIGQESTPIDIWLYVIIAVALVGVVIVVAVMYKKRSSSKSYEGKNSTRIYFND